MNKKIRPITNYGRNVKRKHRKSCYIINKQKAEIYLSKQKIDLLVYIIVLQNHYLNVPIKLPNEFNMIMTKLSF